MYGSILGQCLPCLPVHQEHIQHLFKDQLQIPPYLNHNFQRTLNGCIVLKVPQLILMIRQALETFQEQINSLRKELYFTNLHITSSSV